MSNVNTRTGINAGELSEAVLAIQVVAQQTGMTHAQIVTAALTSPPAPAITVGGVTLRLDGKSRKAFGEVRQNVGTPTPIYSNLVNVAQPLATTICAQTGKVYEVSVLGGGKSKCDVRVKGVHADVPLSLKYGHAAPTRRQSPLWATLKQAYMLLGIDISFFASQYAVSYASFSTGGLRYSNKKADYTPALEQACNDLRDTEWAMWVGIQNSISSIFDPHAAANGMLSMYLGGESVMYYADMASGALSKLSNSCLASLTQDLQAGPVSVKLSRSPGGRTQYFKLNVGSACVLSAYSTVSTNMKSGQNNPNLREPKPQTYFTPDIVAAKYLAPVP